MASKIKYAVSATPIYELSDTEGGPINVIAKDIGKTVCGGGESACGYASTEGFAAGVPTYVKAGDDMATSATALSLGTLSATKFIYIKHTGFEWDAVTNDGSTLGDATDKQVKITTAATIANAGTIAVLNPGDSIILPFNTALTPTLFSAGDGVFVSMEVMSVQAT